jgi:Zn-dependent protease with chaperone function
MADYSAETSAVTRQGAAGVADASARAETATSLANDLARSYQPRRVWASAVSIGWNLLLAGGFIGSGMAVWLYRQIAPTDGGAAATPAWWVTPVYLMFFFGGYAALNFPLELWFGYLQERQFGLAKDGVRAWARDWFIGMLQHGMMFLIGSYVLLCLQGLFPGMWLVAGSGVLLMLFVATTYFAGDLIPPGLFHFQRADEATLARLKRVLAMDRGNLADADGETSAVELPPVVVYSHPSLREFAGGIVGMGNRKRLLISRSSLELGSDTMLRFVLLHDLGHRRYHHNLLSALAGWAWVVIGLALGHRLIPARWENDTAIFGSPIYIAFLAVTISAWMVIGEPFLAYFGRRLEYQADRFYLRSGGSLDEMHAALDELARQNLARTEAMRRRETIFHPLPSISNRLFEARKFEMRRRERGER